MKKIIKYTICIETNLGTEAEPNIQQKFQTCTIKCDESTFDSNYSIAEKEAYNGEITVEDDGTEEYTAPSQLDVIEAQVTYTAMMTDTLLEV